MIKLFLAILLIVAISFPSRAEITNRQHHDIHHVTGSCVGTAYLNHAGYSWQKSAIIMLLLGVAWETTDHIFYISHTKSSIFDYRKGFDVFDVGRNCIGIGLSFPIRK